MTVTPARLQPYRAVTVKTLAGPKATTVSESDARFAEIKSITSQFITWLETKPADEEYSFLSINECAFAQFLIANGYSDRPRCSQRGWADRSGNEHPQPEGIEEPLREFPWTFGALRERLIEANPPRIPELPRVVSEVRRLDPEIWGNVDVEG